jgi:chorismate mutase-like protein
MQDTQVASDLAGQPHPLDGLRAEIDEVDEQILRLARRRIQICETVALVKRDHDIPMMQNNRIATVRARFTALAGELGLSPEFALRLYEVQLAEACRVEDEILAPDA